MTNNKTSYPKCKNHFDLSIKTLAVPKYATIPICEVQRKKLMGASLTGKS